MVLLISLKWLFVAVASFIVVYIVVTFEHFSFIALSNHMLFLAFPSHASSYAIMFLNVSDFFPLRRVYVFRVYVLSAQLGWFSMGSWI